MALMEMNWRPSNRDLRLFAVAQLVLATIGAWVIHLRLGWDAPATGLLVVSLALLLMGLVLPQLLRPVFVLWMLAAFPIGWVMSHVLLALVYFGVLTPIGIILRMRGRDSLQLKSRTDAETYWIERPQPRESSQYFRQY